MVRLNSQIRHEYNLNYILPDFPLPVPLQHVSNSLSLSNDIFLHSNILVATFEKKNRGEITIDRPRERREDEKLVGGGELISKRAIVVETCRVTKHRTF